jgi:hypothetical protein
MISQVISVGYLFGVISQFHILNIKRCPLITNPILSYPILSYPILSYPRGRTSSLACQRMAPAMDRHCCEDCPVLCKYSDFYYKSMSERNFRVQVRVCSSRYHHQAATAEDIRLTRLPVSLTALSDSGHGTNDCAILSGNGMRSLWHIRFDCIV